MINFIYFASFYLTGDLGRQVSKEIAVNYVIVCNLIWLLSAASFGLYTTYGARKLERIYRGTWRSATLHFVLFAIYLVFTKGADFSRTFLVIFYVLLGSAFVVNRFLGTAFQYLLMNKFNGSLKVAVMGANDTATRLIDYLKRQRSLEFYGTIGDDASIYFKENDVIAAQVSEKLAAAVLANVKDIYVAVAPERMADVQALIEEAERQCVHLKFIPDLSVHISANYNISYLGGEFPIITLRNEPLEEIGARFKKRLFDLVFSSLVFIFILWWLIPLIAILIKLDSKGPVFFLQNRAGRNNKHFKVFKFRTMTVTESDGEYKQAKRGDARISKVGSFLRRTSLDEMPQFINVLFGDMSVVGPRPHPLLMNDHFQEIINKYMVRHYVKPGITGWAQVNGFRGETKEKEDMENRVKYDIYYLENWTAMLDVKIVFMTIINVAQGEEQAY
ncbi:undecaprenyl-phosphate glucose phosphotransferase [Pedobacter sp. LMG 31464]|uniref:Undecaprenyl-phosphate glucose phosphotransferase n=2 Tax=Pedobacter planticolens TaxID=2679964 RepID=A0A923E0L7_9SPHI|nr:undecaprenyl-phosphate glucose phosphotransferase [Pedobacter planticolens]